MKVNVGTPTQNGMYVIYTAGVFERFPDKMLMTFINGEWGYPRSDQRFRMHVDGWIGPLPNPTMEALTLEQLKKGRADAGYAYAIGPEAEKYTDGPFFDLTDLLNHLGNEGEYIFKIDSEGNAKAIRKWVERKGKWLRIKKKS